MSEQQQNPAIELFGLGVHSTTPIKASPERVWEAMVDKMYHTEKYLPVSNVQTTDKVPGQHTYREMDLNGETLCEDIYFDKSRFEIRTDMVHSDEVHMNLYHPDTGLLEYWQENKKGERIPWHVPKNVVLKAMEKVKERAEANE